MLPNEGWDGLYGPGEVNPEHEGAKMETPPGLIPANPLDHPFVRPGTRPSMTPAMGMGLSREPVPQGMFHSPPVQVVPPQPRSQSQPQQSQVLVTPDLDQVPLFGPGFLPFGGLPVGSDCDLDLPQQPLMPAGAGIGGLMLPPGLNFDFFSMLCGGTSFMPTLDMQPIGCGLPEVFASSDPAAAGGYTTVGPMIEEDDDDDDGPVYGHDDDEYRPPDEEVVVIDSRGVTRSVRSRSHHPTRRSTPPNPRRSTTTQPRTGPPSTPKRAAAAAANRRRRANQKCAEGQIYCCIKDCDGVVKNRSRFCLRITTQFKTDYLNKEWNRVCSRCYFSDLYKSKKAEKAIKGGGQ